MVIDRTKIFTGAFPARVLAEDSWWLSPIDLLGSVNAHRIGLGVPVPEAGKGELAAVRRPGGVAIVGVVEGQPGQVAAVGAHGVDLAAEGGSGSHPRTIRPHRVDIVISVAVTVEDEPVAIW